MYTSADLQRHIGKFYGKYSGEVMSNEDEEKRGRLLLCVPSIFGTAEANRVWARPCLPFGHFFIPDVGARVWVEFEAGDPRYPIWVGTWYLAGAVPPEAAVKPPVQRVVHTPSGHIVQFGDEQDDEKIIIRHKTNAFVSIDKDGSVLIANANGSLVHLNAADGRLMIVEEHQNVVVLNEEGVKVVNGDGTTLELKGGKARVIATESAQVEAPSVVVKAGSINLGDNPTQPAILGQLFAALFDAHTHPTAMGPSGPPVPLLSPSPALSQRVKIAGPP